MQSTVESNSKVHRVVFELNSKDPSVWEGVLNNIENSQKAFGEGTTEIELVAHGEGIYLLVKKDNPVSERLHDLSGQNVIFAACNNTMKRKKLSVENLLDFSQPVDSGVAEVIRKQESGWAYLKSGA